MSNEFHAEAQLCCADTSAGVKRSPECDPSLRPPPGCSPPSILHANQRLCQAYFCLCSSVQTHSLSRMFSLSFPLPESCLPSKAPSGLCSHTPPQRGFPWTPAARVGGSSWMCAARCSRSFYTLDLYAQPECPLAPGHRCFISVRCPCGVPPLSL